MSSCKRSEKYVAQFPIFLFVSISAYVLIIPVLILYFFIRKKSGRKQSIFHIIAVYVFCYYSFGILTVYRYWLYKHNIISSPNFYNSILWYDKLPIDTILNLVLFVPLGFFLPLLYKKYQHIKNVILTGFLFSLSIEIVQMFGWGATDINDLIINTAGACLGYLIYYLVSRILPINFRKRLQSENVNDMVEIMLYAIYIFIVMITVQPWVIHSLLNIG